MPRYPEQPVFVEYDFHDKRVVKKCDNPYAAKSFYVRKFKDGKNPKIVKGSTNDQN